MCPDSEFSDQERVTKVPLRVIHNQSRPLKEIPVPELLLDGYPSTEQAVFDLRTYYDDTTKDSVMQSIGTIPEEIWVTLSQEKQQLLITKSLDELQKNPDFRDIFLPALLYWFTTYEPHVVDWQNFLIDAELVTEEEITQVVEASALTPDKYIDAVVALGGLSAILDLDFDQPIHQSVVLQKPVPLE